MFQDSSLRGENPLTESMRRNRVDSLKGFFMGKKVYKNKEKDYARRKVQCAVNRGKLIRPDKCQRCKNESKLGKDGRSTIQAHHSDYSKPMDIEWLCAKCHRTETQFLGEKNGASKLTEETVRLIRESKKTCVQIALELGVHNSTVSRARRGVHWK